VAKTEQLSFVYVEGSLIFPSGTKTDVKTFDTGYIMILKGYMEVGTEEYPYQSKLTITMHGNVRTPTLPTYGNKVIGVRFGELSMHGIERKTTWSELDITADVGAKSITLI